MGLSRERGGTASAQTMPSTSIRSSSLDKYCRPSLLLKCRLKTRLFEFRIDSDIVVKQSPNDLSLAASDTSP